MKICRNLIAISTFLLLNICSYIHAQDSVYINLSNGFSIPYQISKIDNISFLKNNNYRFVNHYDVINSISDSTLLENNRVTLEDNAIQSSYEINLNLYITKFDTIILGNGYKSYGGSYLSIDNNNINIFSSYSGEQLIQTIKHGLSIKTQLSVKIIKTFFTAKIIITSGIKQFETEIPWDGVSNPFVESKDSEIRIKYFSFLCDNWDKSIFMFGDSYCSFTDPNRWPYYLYLNDYIYFLMDSQPGANSEEEYDRLLNSLKHGTPKFIVWTLGMNDGSDSGTYNIDWFTILKKVEQLCKDKGIDLIMCTVPTVPNRNNRLKNQYIRNSGYRFIDFDAAVSDGNGNWYEGMLYSDQVHPTATGAKALTNRFFQDFPEIKKLKN